MLPKQGSFAQSVRYHRIKDSGRPKIPHSFEDLQDPLPIRYTVLPNGNPFLLMKDVISEDTEKLFVAFMSPFGKKLLRNANVWAMDGTFKTAPAPFKQVFVIMAQLPNREKFLPSCYAVLPDKCGETYSRLLGALQSALAEDEMEDVPWQPERIVVDFETAIHNAIEEWIPEAEIIGCRFHFRKAVRFQLGDKNCIQSYNRSRKFQNAKGMMEALSLVPLSDVVKGWEIVVEPKIAELLKEEESKILDDRTIDLPAVTSFFRYFEKTYIGRINQRTGIRCRPMFQHPMWNYYQDIINDKVTTNNITEGWNSSWSRSANSFMNVWSTFDAFIKEDALATQKYVEITTSVRAQGDGVTVHDKTGRIKILAKEFSNLGLQQYLNEMGAILNF